MNLITIHICDLFYVHILCIYIMGFVPEINLFYFVVEAGEQTGGDLAATR